MKKQTIFILGVLIAACAAIAAGGYNTAVYHEQGGSRVVVATGGALDVESGGEIDVESGGSLKLSGTAVTSTAAELNILDGVTSTATELNILDGVTATSGEVQTIAAAAQLSDGLLVKKYARATLDCNAASACGVGTVALGQSLPAKSIIALSFFEVSTQFVDGGAGTVALHCEDADNIFAAADITGDAVGSIVSGIQSGAVELMTGAIAATCELTATIATAEQTSGVLNLFLDYYVHD